MSTRLRALIAQCLIKHRHKVSEIPVVTPS